MRQTHKGGEKCFVDYCGPTVPIINGSTGEVREAQIFVAVLGASNYTYAKATWTQKLYDWVGSHVNAFEFFSGVPSVLVPDNLKSATKKPCRYEAQINDSYLHMANYFSTAVITARPYKPKDKAKAEAGVLLVERWILACLRHDTFFSLADLNGKIRTLLNKLNNKPFQKMDGSRRSLYEQLDRPALQQLPPERYHFTQFKRARVNIDYHIQFNKNYYSVPHHLCRLEVQVQATRESVAVFYKGQQVARHPRNHLRGQYTTNTTHMPEAHRNHHKWTPERLLQWGCSIGPDTHKLVEIMLSRKRHPEQAYRSCLGLLNLAKQYDNNRLNNACRRAIEINSPNYRSVKSILSKRLDNLVETPETLDQRHQSLLNDHDNIRGPMYYH
jgi:transposase